MKGVRGSGAHHEHDGDEGDDGEVLEWLDGNGRSQWKVKLGDNELNEGIGYKESSISSLTC